MAASLTIASAITTRKLVVLYSLDIVKDTFAYQIEADNDDASYNHFLYVHTRQAIYGD